MSKQTQHKSDAELRRGWRVYKLANRIIQRVRPEETKCIRGVWFGRRSKDDFTILMACPAKKNIPTFAAVRIDYKGTTVLDSIHNKNRHDVLTFTPGKWERLIRSMLRKEHGNV